MSTQTAQKSTHPWTFLTNHAHVLVCLAQQPDAPLREVAREVGITERAAQRIVADLEEARVIRRERIGRNNHYRIYRSAHLRHPLEKHVRVGELLNLIE